MARSSKTKENATGKLVQAMRLRFDEIELEGDLEAMQTLEVQALLVVKTWCHMNERVAKAESRFGDALHWAHVAHRLQQEIERGLRIAEAEREAAEE